MNKRSCLFAVSLICFFIVMCAAPAFAEEAAGSGGYLAGYENADPKPSPFSWWSTFAYLLSLLAVFAFVVILAYLATRFLSGRLTQKMSGEGGRLLAHLPLGPNRSICIAELAERVFMLGVTDHNITLLKEITDEAEIERLHRMDFGNGLGYDPFAEQFGSLRDLTKRIPSLFKDGINRR